MGVNIWQLLLVLLVVILLFGRGRIPALMGDVAAGIRNFKQGMADDEHATLATHQNTEKAAAGIDEVTSQPASVEQKNA